MLHNPELIALGRRSKNAVPVWLHVACLMQSGDTVETFLCANGNITSLTQLRQSGWEVYLAHSSEKRNLLTVFDNDHEDAEPTEAQERSELMTQAKMLEGIYGSPAIQKTLEGLASDWKSLRAVDFPAVRHRLDELEHRAFGVRS